MSTQGQTQIKVTPTPSSVPAQTQLLQRKCNCGGSPGMDEECAECREKRLASPRNLIHTPTIQTKLTINRPGDRYEQEADRIAERIMRMPEPVSSASRVLQRQAAENEEDEELRRQPMEDEADEEETVQAKETPGQTPQVTPALQTRVDSLRGGGQPLPQSTRDFMEARFGHDFSQVRIHTDAQAAETARAVNARAYTLGHDVVFGEGRYAPGTNDGRRLLAHELTHVVQQGYTARLMDMGCAIQQENVGEVAGTVSNRASASMLTRAPIIVQREPDPSTPAEASDPFDEFAFPEYSWWLIGPYFDEMPTLEQIRRVIVSDSSVDADVLSSSSVRFIARGEQRKSYWSFKHPSLGVVARAYGEWAGLTGGKDAIYGVYLFRPNSLKRRASSDESRTGVSEERRVAGTKTQTKTGVTREEKPAGIPSEVRDFYQGTAIPKERQLPTDELIRMYNIFTKYIKGNPRWAKQGQSFKEWVDFLDKNGKQLRGRLEQSPTGKLRLETLKRLTAKLQQGEALEFPDKEERELSEKARQAALKEGITPTSGPPEWLLLPKADRKLLLEVMEKHPDLFTDTLAGEERDVKVLTVEAKRLLVLQIAAKYFPGEIGKSLLDMAKDPTFWLKTGAILAIYVALWLAPEPFSKIAATALTAFLLIYFGWSVIKAFAHAWTRMDDSCKDDARTGAEIEKVAQQFAADLGPTGAALLLLIATWVLGRAVQAARARGGGVEPPPDPARVPGPPKLRAIRGGGGKPPAPQIGSRPVRISGGGAGTAKGGAAPAAKVDYAPSPQEVPAQPPPVRIAPPPEPALPEAQPGAVQAGPKPGPLTPARVSAATATAAKQKERKERRAYPLCWPRDLLPEPQYPRGVFWKYFVRKKSAERDDEDATQRRMELRWRQFRDPDFVPGLYHIHHVVPLFLGGPDILRPPGTINNNGVIWQKDIHLKGHRILRNQPQMADPARTLPLGLRPLSADMYDSSHKDGTLYELVGNKDEGECPP